MMKEEYIKYAAYIHMSRYRESIMMYLYEKEYATPTGISKGIGRGISHVSKTLTDLEGRGFVVCVNGEVRKGRLYSLTDLGYSIVEHLKFLKES